MSSNINLNSNVSQSLHTVQKNQKKLDSSFEKLASGKRINKPSDDIIGSAKVVSLESISRGIDAVSQYTSYRNSENGIQQGQLSQNLESLQQARELAVRASDATISPTERDALVTQLSDLNVSADLSSQSSANDSITSLSSSITDVANQMSRLGSESNVMDLQEQSNQTQQENIESARSRIEDADLAQVISQQVQNQLRLGFSMQVLQQSEQSSFYQSLKLLS